MMSSDEKVRALDERIKKKLCQDRSARASTDFEQPRDEEHNTTSFLDERIRRETHEESSANGRTAPLQNAKFEQLIESKIVHEDEPDSPSSRIRSSAQPSIAKSTQADVADNDADMEVNLDQLEDHEGPWLPPSIASEPVLHDEGYLKKIQAKEDIQDICPRAQDEQADAIDIESGEFVNHDGKRAPAARADVHTPPKASSSVSTHSTHHSDPPFFAVEATLVKEASSYESSSPVYDAVLVPEQSPVPWWKRGKVFGLLIVAAAIATAVGVSLSSGNGKTAAGDSTETHPTFYAPPFNCNVSSLRPLYDTDSDYNMHLVSLDGEGGTVATVRALDSFSSRLKIIEGNESSTFDLGYWVGTIAVSDDLVVVGAGGSPQDNWTGSVHLFEKDSSGWNETSIIVPRDIDDGADFGNMIEIHEDVMVVTAPNDRDTIGSAFVYRRTDGLWQEEAKITPVGQGNQNFGGSVAVKGLTLVIGDDMYGADEDGAVYVYEHDSSAKPSPWILKHNITNADCGKHFGSSVGLTNDLNVLVGCPGRESMTGAVYYYTQQGGQYTMHQEITASDGQIIEEFGEVLVVDGNLMAVGTTKQINAKLYIFTHHQGVWKELIKIQAPSVNVSYFGSDFALSGDDVLISYWGNVLPYQLNCSD